MTTAARKVFSFATMMVLAQRRHEARMAEGRQSAAMPGHGTTKLLRAELAQRTLDHLSATRRLLAVVNASAQAV